nr:unnamed protein product [Callosobruchus analis]
MDILKSKGKHGNHAKVDQKVKDGIRLHINSIPRIPSHYCCSGSSREFIEGEKSLAEIHRDYAKLCKGKGKNKPAANYMIYI